MPSITIQSPKVARQQMAVLLRTIDTYVEVYDHEPKTFGGLSPVATVHGAPGSEFLSLNAHQHRQEFYVTVYWRRDDASDTENSIDDLFIETLYTLLNNSSTTAHWKQLLVNLDTDDAGYVIMDGVQYRYRRIPVTAIVLCT